MKASVIFSTYNQTAWLEKTMLGFAAQDRSDFEVLVADDGSKDETRALIERLRPRMPYALKHVWQPDDGFQKCRILNKAIVASESDYLIFTDGDCIPRADFVSAHLRYRAPRRFLSGGYFKLPMSISEAITGDDIASGRCFDLSWLRQQGLPFAARNVKLAAQGTLAASLDALVTARASWNGHNASGWKADVVAANGFDERMGYGGEDRELGERLENAGITGKRIRHRAIVIHLDHPRGYVRQDIIEKNKAIRAETRSQRLVRTAHGLREHASE
jgi:glycosyltransferase involved in cell wall biosynthesis